MSQRAIGICLGASNIKVVELTSNNEAISVTQSFTQNHGSTPQDALQSIIDKLSLSPKSLVAFTGRKFKDIVNAPSITEAEAVEYALSFERKNKKATMDANVLVSLGAESFIAYKLNSDGTINDIETGNKCASGTGEFFLQQTKRMDVSVSEAISLAKGAEIYPVSGRCSVFCKSDCTHALNKGIPIGRVSSGLCRMMSEKVMELLEKMPLKKVIAVGGVTQNALVMQYLRESVDTLNIPEYTMTFESLGAAYYALQKGVYLNSTEADLFKMNVSSFSVHRPFEEVEHLVTFADSQRGVPQKGDRCIVGLDVGSTTTKAVLLRASDNRVLASEYLRTNGDPVQAARHCFASINAEINTPVEIFGLGVTGSGRHIAGLHASATSIVNEIIAHATGAAFYDTEVDTIFEIGGQDAKYTHLTNGVPSDYAMNEACSAGTGSFLEESAHESLGIDFREIEKIARTGKSPANFNDQCAAFISSDIKTAIHEGIKKADIVAGLVYSIAMNYVNRVKGQRPIGNKVFMQGGVCYNKAVPLAMASLIGKPIIVPPDPGLVGAFGVALEVKNRIKTGLDTEGNFNLRELADREIAYGKSFICHGGTEKCDRHCEIAMLIINNKKIPFGGACDRFYNKRHNREINFHHYDLVSRRQQLIYNRDNPPVTKESQTIGLSRSYLMNSFFPLFHTFFSELGLEVILSDAADPTGLKRRRSSFCYPGELSHGFFGNLLKKKPDYVFIPKIMSLKVDKGVSVEREHQSTCVLLQSEAYYLKSAFKDSMGGTKLLTPIIDLWQGFEGATEAFITLACTLGYNREKALSALKKAVSKQEETQKEIRAMGAAALKELEANQHNSAVVLFGRAYNAFAKEANMGIPQKFASRGITIIPWDALPFDDEECDKDMCWAIGQEIQKAANFVKKHPQLFGTYITNFSCGPDSFLLGNFRDIMQTKPSLTLELDSHTADAGINTRIEAFWDILTRYLELKQSDAKRAHFKAAETIFKGSTPFFRTSQGDEVSFFNKRVRLLVPSMGELSSEALAAAFRGIGVQSEAIPGYDHEDLHLGRSNSSCKECLPLLLTVGGLLKYIENRDNSDELLAYFMPFTPGNCRFPQYRVFFNTLIRKKQLTNVTLFSLSAEKGYSYKAFSGLDRLNVLKSFITADVMEDIRNTLNVIAVDRESAAEIFDNEWARIITLLGAGKGRKLHKLLASVAQNLTEIPLKKRLEETPKVGLVGEIFVRRDYFSCKDLIERLSKRGIIVKRAHFFEWLKYVDTIIKRGIYDPHFTFRERFEFGFKLFLQAKVEKKIKGILTKSGLYEYEFADIDKILETGEQFFDTRFRGESILIAGNYFKDVLESMDGVISIGPFACMPARVIEAVLTAESTLETKQKVDGHNRALCNALKETGVSKLPFLSIETDGNPFPQVLEAKIEAFSLQVERLNNRVRQAHEKQNSGNGPMAT